jgi:hypothetical protein
MPALNGQVVMTLRDGTGATVIQYTMSWTPATGNLRDAVVATSTGNRTGALVVDNQTGRTVRVLVRDTTGTDIRSFSVTPSGAALTVAQLAGIPAPNGPVTTMAQLSGMTFDLT